MVVVVDEDEDDDERECIDKSAYTYAISVANGLG
jgi:hypothetical protein